MQERCLHMYMMRMFPLVCVSPMWLASIGQDLLVRVAVSSIHICVAAQELDVASRLNYTVNAELTGVLCVRGFLDNKSRNEKQAILCFCGSFCTFSIFT